MKSVMSTIPNYVMQGAALPMHLCDKLDKVSRDFLWGSSQGKSKMHLVGWNKIIKSKEEGGLGIQATRAKNLALLAKFNWRLYHEKDAIWAKVLLNKYCSQSRRNCSDPDKLPCSSIWKAVKQGFHVFSKGIAWSVGNNSKLKFWTNNWVKGSSLRELIEGPLQQWKDKIAVKGVFRDGEWKWNELSFQLPVNVKELISATPIQLYGSKEDTLSWKASKNGEFSAASAYDLARLKGDQESTFLGKWVWEVDTMPKIAHFLWLCHHNSVPVRGVIAERGMQYDTTYPLCRNGTESISHLLKECPFAIDFWRKIGVPTPLISSFTLDCLAWLKRNSLCNVQIQSHGIPWRSLFPFAVWGLWKHRNRVVCENTTLNLSLHKACINLAVEYFFCVGKSVQPQQQGCILLKWNKPNVGRHKLNTDGASMGNPGKAGGRGVIRDHRGCWVQGFVRKIGITSSVS